MLIQFRTTRNKTTTRSRWFSKGASPETRAGTKKQLFGVEIKETISHSFQETNLGGEPPCESCYWLTSLRASLSCLRQALLRSSPKHTASLLERCSATGAPTATVV